MRNRGRNPQGSWKEPKVGGAVRVWLSVIAVTMGVGLVTDAQAQPQSRGSRAVAMRQPAPVAEPEAERAAEGVVNVNTASAEELERLPGIGPARAAAILELRQRLGGRFRTVEDLLRVRGIGRATLRRLRPMMVLSGETTLRDRPRRSSAVAELVEN